MKNLPLTTQFGQMLVCNPHELMEASSGWLRDLLYDHKLLVIRGLGELTPSQLFHIHLKFGAPWSDTDYMSTINEPHLTTELGRVPIYRTSGLHLLKNSMPWHRDIPWHEEVHYPIRSLYSLHNYITPTKFVDCDVLLKGPLAPLTTSIEMRIQYWYDRQHDQGLVPCRYLEKWIPLVEYCLDTPAVMLNSFGLKDCFNPTVEYQSDSKGAWIMGCRVNDLEYEDDDYLELFEMLHMRVVQPWNIYTHHWEKHDLVLFNNMSGVFHMRPPIAKNDAARIFWRMNLRHWWQTEPVSPWDLSKGPRHMNKHESN